MGDIIGGIFGTSSSTTQETTPDPIQMQSNLERLNQIVNLFQSGSLQQFAGRNYATSTPTAFSTDISSIAHNAMLADAARPMDENNMSLWDYRDSFNPIIDTFRNADADVGRRMDAALTGNDQDYDRIRGIVDSTVQGSRGRSGADYATGIAGQDAAYMRATQAIDARYNEAIARGDYDLARSLELSKSSLIDTLARNEGYANSTVRLNEGNFLRSLDTQDFNRERALELGIGGVGNYVDQIARPRLNNALTLQGLESGGAVPVALARATAEQAMPFLQSLESAYSTNQANTLNALMSLQSGVGTQLMSEQAAAQQLATQGSQAATLSASEGNRALGGEALQSQAAAAANYANNINQLAQMLMQNNISLEQAGITANSALGQQLLQAQNQLRVQRQEAGTQLSNTFGQAQANFVNTLPAASQALSLLPGQQAAQQAAYLTALAPLADFPRQLEDADFQRRQNLFTSVFTGIPVSAGSTTTSGSATGNLADQMGGFIQSSATGGGNLGG